MTNHLALIKKRPTSRISPASHRGRKIVARCAGGDPLWQGVAQGRVRYERFWALLATVGGEAVWGSASGVLAITRSPESKMSAALSGGDRSEERNASSRPVPRPRPGLPDRSSLSRLVHQERYATASGIGEGAHAAAASVAGNCQCHAGVRKAALPDGRRCGAARRQAKLANQRAELSSRPPGSPVRVLRCSEHVPSMSRAVPERCRKRPGHRISHGFGPS